MEKIAKINELIKELEVMEPLISYSDPTNDGEHAMVEGLAKMFADKGMRSYLEMEYNRTKDKSLQCTDMYGIMFLKARAVTLKELLVKGNAAFQNYNKLNGSSKK